MAKGREFELHMLRFIPHPLRDDFVTVGLLLREDGGFADVRFTQDWQMLQSIAPDVEMDWFEMVEREIRENLRGFRRREELMQLVSERFGSMIDVSPTKAVLTNDPGKEMEALASIYLAPMKPCGRALRRTGRIAIMSTMKEVFSSAGVLELVQRELVVEKYTGPGDPFRVDFGYQVNGLVKMFHAVSVASNVDQALALLYRYGLVVPGMQQEGLQAALTAVVDERSALAEEKVRFAIGRLKQHCVRVEPVEKAAEIADEVRQDAESGRLSWIAGAAA